MKVSLTSAAQSEKPVVERLLQLYLYDMAEFANEGWRDVDANGLYTYKFLDSYWSDDTRHPFLVRANDVLAGFVLVNEYVHLPRPEWIWANGSP